MVRVFLDAICTTYIGYRTELYVEGQRCGRFHLQFPCGSMAQQGGWEMGDTKTLGAEFFWKPEKRPGDGYLPDSHLATGQ